MFFAVWVMVVLGIISADMNMHTPHLYATDFSLRIFFVFLGLTLLISAAFISNQIADVKNDLNNQKLSLIGKYISVEKGKSIAQKLLITGGVISIITSWITAIPVICIYFLRRFAYEQGSFEWKNVPISSWFINSFIGMLLFIIGWLLGMKNYPHNGIILLSLDTITHMLPYLLCFASVSLLTTLLEMKSNNNSGVDKNPIVFEVSISLLVSLLMVIIALYFGIKHADPLAATATLVSLPFFIFAAFRRMNKDILRAIRYPIFILNFFSLTYYPWLALPLFCTYYLSKYYYWHRFDVHYPTFLVDND
jgi:hypothetical protein